jgi:hypothetical protein
MGANDAFRQQQRLLPKLMRYFTAIPSRRHQEGLVSLVRALAEPDAGPIACGCVALAFAICQRGAENAIARQARVETAGGRAAKRRRWPREVELCAIETLAKRRPRR